MVRGGEGEGSGEWLCEWCAWCECVLAWLAIHSPVLDDIRPLLYQRDGGPDLLPRDTHRDNVYERDDRHDDR